MGSCKVYLESECTIECSDVIVSNESNDVITVVGVMGVITVMSV